MINPDKPATPSTTSGFGLGAEEVKRRHIFAKTLVVGVVAGLVASAFRVVLQLAERQRMSLITQLPWPAALALALGLGAIGGGAGLWLVRRYAPEAAGSGIPHLKSVAVGDRSMRWRRVIPVKFVASVLGIGGGLALGREGPTIQMGGATGLAVSEWFRVKPGEGERKALICAGAGGGLAAAFNAPLSGVMFVLEEMHGSFTPLVFVGAFIASAIADVVARLLTGEMPVFAIRDTAAPTVSALPAAVALGAACGVLGIIFNKCLLMSLDGFDRLRRVPPLIVGGLVGVVVGAVGFAWPGVAGSGGSLAESALVGAIALHWIPALVGIRFLVTMISYGSGAAGGIFAPLLVIGALTGLGCGHALHAIAPTLAPDPRALAVIGMGSLLTAVVRAPLTSIVLMVELTGKPEYMLPLLASCITAYGVAEYAKSPPIYEALRHRAEMRAAPTLSDASPPKPVDNNGAEPAGHGVEPAAPRTPLER